MTKNICPVCGYPDLAEPPYHHGIESYEICSSCGFEFGVSDHDEGYSYEKWRAKWIKAGMNWHKKPEPPINWDPKKQLLNIGIKI